MNRPIHPDDPELTAYALGEMTAGEAAEFEARLKHSPEARVELESMRGMMSLLYGGLRSEWEECASRPGLVLVEAPQSEPAPSEGSAKVVTGAFRPSRRSLGLAAAAVAALLALAVVAVGPRGGGGPPVELAATVESSGVDADDAAEESGIWIPKLYLADEIDLPGSIDLAEMLADDSLAREIDATYLEAADAAAEWDSASHPGRGSAAFPAMGRALSTSPAKEVVLDRVDSYLPPVVTGRRPAESGMIDLRARESFGSPGDSSRVLVRGYFAMEGDGAEAPSSHVLPVGFHPVAMSGNPMAPRDAELRIVSDMHAMQGELSRIMESLPADAEEREELQRILDKSRQVTAEIKREFSH